MGLEYNIDHSIALKRDNPRFQAIAQLHGLLHPGHYQAECILVRDGDSIMFAELSVDPLNHLPARYRNTNTFSDAFHNDHIDARRFIFFDKDAYNTISLGFHFEDHWYSEYANFMARSEILLLPTPLPPQLRQMGEGVHLDNLWTVDSQPARDRSVRVLRRTLDDYDITIAPR